MFLRGMASALLPNGVSIHHRRAKDREKMQVFLYALFVPFTFFLMFATYILCSVISSNYFI